MTRVGRIVIVGGVLSIISSATAVAPVEARLEVRPKLPSISFEGSTPEPDTDGTPAWVGNDGVEVDVAPAATWRSDAEVDLVSDWSEFLTTLGVDRTNLDAIDVNSPAFDRSTGVSMRGRSSVTLPGLSAGESDIYRMDDNAHVLVPVFASGEVMPVSEVELFVWRGRSQHGTAVLSFLNDADVGWQLAAGFVGDELGTMRNVSGTNGVATIRTIASPVGLSNVDSVEQAVDGIRSAGLIAPRVVNVGNVNVDLLAVGINEPTGERVSLQDLAPKALAGVAAFNTAMDDSSSTNWVISGVHATLRGLMIIDVPNTPAPHSVYGDHDLLDGTDATTGVVQVANALGVDAVGGYRVDYDKCGLAEETTNVFVWQSKDNDDCQNDESYTFAHELAHLAWAHHRYSYCDDASAPKPVTDGTNWNCPGGTATVRTLMGRTSTSTPSARVLRFSNADLTFASGRPLGAGGVNDNNNAARIADKVVSELSSRRTYVGPSGGRYTPLEVPERVVDTRPSQAIGGYSSVQNTSAREYPVLAPSVPSGAVAVAVNLVVISPSSTGTLQVVNSESQANGTTLGSVRFKAGGVRAQTVVVLMSTYRTIWMRTTSGSVDVIADVVGYFSPSGSYLHPLTTSVRAFDGTVSANTDGTVWLSSIADCPSSTTAAAVNIVAVAPAAAGHVAARGLANSWNDTYSTVNYQPGKTIANATFVEVDAQAFKIRPLTTTRIIVDVFGCFTTSSSGGKQLAMYNTPTDRGTSTLGNTGHVDVAVGGVSNAVALTVADVTSTTTNAAHLWAYMPTVALPATSNINLTPGDGISNLMVTPTVYLSGAHRIRVKRNTNTTGTVTVRIIQLGYFY